MLDAKELAARLRAAMDLRDPVLKQAQLAQRCNVTGQAVHSWRTDGRISKGQLLTIARETGVPIEFFLEAERGASSATLAAWKRLGESLIKSWS